MVNIRRAGPADLRLLAPLRYRLWPDAEPGEHESELEAMLGPGGFGVLPQAIFIAETEDGIPAGFLEAALRSYADGCDAARPVGYVEGWYVEPEWRCTGIGRQLIAAAEAWAREQGCLEMASDTEVDNTLSLAAHLASGFEEVGRVIQFRKPL